MKKSFLDLKVTEAVQLVKEVVIDEKIRQEFNRFIDRIGENADVCIREIVGRVSENVVTAVSDALSNKVSDIKRQVEGESSDERKPNDGSNLGGENRSDSFQET